MVVETIECGEAGAKVLLDAATFWRLMAADKRDQKARTVTRVIWRREEDDRQFDEQYPVVKEATSGRNVHVADEEATYRAYVADLRRWIKSEWYDPLKRYDAYPAGLERLRVRLRARRGEHLPSSPGGITSAWGATSEDIRKIWMDGAIGGRALVNPFQDPADHRREMNGVRSRAREWTCQSVERYRDWQDGIWSYQTIVVEALNAAGDVLQDASKGGVDSDADDEYLAEVIGEACGEIRQSVTEGWLLDPDGLLSQSFSDLDEE